jgi:general secretion pathway protein C
MLLVLRRRFWVVGLTCALLCTFFAGRAVAHVIEGALLSDSTHAPAVTAAPPPVETAVARSKSGTSMVTRNLFCSACAPDVAAVSSPAAAASGDAVPMTQLPLQLIATSIGDKSRMATIVNTQTSAQGGYLLTGEIPGAGPIVAIEYQHVDFQNRASGRVERIGLLAAAPPVVTTPLVKSTAVATATPPSNDPMKAAIDAGIHKLDDTTYEIDRSLVEQVLANPMAIAKGARVMPSIKNGQPDGMRVAAIRPDSVFAKLGLQNGDTIHAINGNALDSMSAGLEVYDKVKNANALQIDITRGGKPVSMNYRIE